jgi:adenylosuccinate synthase
MLRYALEVAGGADELAVTCLDRLVDVPVLRICQSYEGPESACLEGGRLNVRPAPNLEYQGQLTGFLERCRPVYTELAAKDLLPWLENALRVPITLTSHGPTWMDKVPFAQECPVRMRAGTLARPSA